MKTFSVVFSALLIAFVASCTFYPIQTQEQVDARHTAQAEALIPTVTLAPVEATATAEIEATAVAIETIEAPQVACDIKANVSKNDKIYHLPGGAYYDRIKVDVSQGDFYACSEQEAIDAGFRKSTR